MVGPCTIFLLSWDKTTSQANSGFQSAYTPGSPNADTWLISPAFDLTGASTAYLHYSDFSISPSEPGGNDEFLVLISTDYVPGNDPEDDNTTNWDILYNVIDIPYNWNPHHIDISDYINISQQTYIAFQYINYDGSNEGSQWFIDDVSVSDDDGCGTQPVPDCATLISPPDGATKMQKDVLLFWDPPSQDISKQLLYVGTNGGGVTTPSNEINGTEYGPTSNGQIVSNLNINTTYYWQIIPANCANEAQNCPIWSFSIGNGNTLFSEAGPTQGGYTFVNSALGLASKPTYNWIDISGTGTDLIRTM